MPVRYSINQSMAQFGPAVEPDHVGLGPGLVDEDQPARVQLRLVPAPFRAGLGDVRSILSGGPERLYGWPALSIGRSLRLEAEERDG